MYQRSLNSGGAIIGATMGYLLFHASETPILMIWYHWLASDAIGIIMVAPFVIGLVPITRDRPSLRETFEGIAALSSIAVVIFLFFCLHASRSLGRCCSGLDLSAVVMD